MKLGIVTRYVGRNDGQGRVNYELAQEARRQGHDVTLFAEAVGEEIASGDGIALDLAAPPGWLPSRLLRDQLFAVRSYRRIRAQRRSCDVLLSNGFATWAGSDVNAIHYLHSSWTRTPREVRRQRSSLRQTYGWLYSRLNVDLEKAALRRSRRVVAVSELVRQDLLGIGLPPDRVVTITNGVDIDEFSPGPGERARFGLPAEPVIALFAGDLSSGRKNLDTVLRAVQRTPGLHLAVAGRAEQTLYPALAAQLGLAGRVHFLGFRRDMPSLMRSVDLFVFPSRYEPFGLALLEAMASGLPVVTARCVGGADLVGAASGSVIENCNDVGACAGALAEFAADDDRRRAAGRRARALAEAHSWRAMAARYLDLLQEVAEERAETAHA